MKYIVQLQHNNLVVGETDDLQEAKDVAGKYLNVNDLVWNLSFTGVWWSDERYGGVKPGVVFHIFEMED